MIDQRKKLAIEGAETAFWEKIAAAYPEATSGDLDPIETFAFYRAIERVVDAWIMFNVP